MSSNIYKFLNIFIILILLFNAVASTIDFKELNYQLDNNYLFKDITNECKKNITTDVFLVYGSGTADSRVMTISLLNANISGCPVNIKLGNINNPLHQFSVIFLFEFFDIIDENLNELCSKDKAAIKIFNQKSLFFELCREFEKEHHNKNTSYFKHIKAVNVYNRAANEVCFTYQINNFSGVIKITATASKNVKSRKECDLSKEINCKIISQDRYCINKFLKCDGIANCGSYTYSDEAKRHCNEINLYEAWKHIILIVLISCLICFILSNIINTTRFPNATEYFVFDDEASTIIDYSQSFPSASESSEMIDLPIIFKANKDCCNRCKHINISLSDSILSKDAQFKQRQRLYEFIYD